MGINASGTNTPHPPGPGTSSGVTRRVAKLAWLLDESIRLPGGYRIGWDGIIGLIPGVGDLAGLGASGYILYVAAQSGAGKAVLLRMFVNVLLETAIGSIPVLGDLFDFFFKANSRNLRLLQRSGAEPVRARRVSMAWLLGALLLSLAAIVGIVVLIVQIIQWLVALAGV